MTDNNSRLRKLAWAIAPIWASRFDAWQQHRAKARRQYERELDRLAAGEGRPIELPSPEPRERLHVDTIFRRLNQRRQQQGWLQYADELSAERRRMTFTNHRGMHEHG